MRDKSEDDVILPWDNQFNIKTICSNFPVLEASLSFWLILGILLIIAVYLLIFGYRFYRFSSFLIAGLLGAVFSYLLCASEKIFELYVSGIIAVVCGLSCALIASLYSKFGFFITGFCVGSIAGAYGVVAVAVLASFKTLWFGLTLCFVCGIFFALLSIFWQKFFSIANTSFVSGFLLFIILDYLLEHLVLAYYGWVILIEASSPALCSYSWVSLLIWPLTFLTGILVQYLKSARYFDHLESKKLVDANDDNDTPKRSINGTLRIGGKSTTPEGSGTKTSKSTLRQYSGTRYTGDIVPKNLAANNALPTTMRTAARMRALAAQNAGTLAAGLPAGMDLGPDYQVVGSTVYYGDTYSEYGPARQPMIPTGTPGGMRVAKGKRRGGPGAKRQSSNTNDSLYEDVDDEDQYCAIDYDQIKNYEYGYAQYGPAPLYMGPTSSNSGAIDAQQLVMLQQQQIYRQQNSRSNTLGSMRGGNGGGGGDPANAMYRMPPHQNGVGQGGPNAQPLYQSASAANSHDVLNASPMLNGGGGGPNGAGIEALQMDNMRSNNMSSSPNYMVPNGGANNLMGSNMSAQQQPNNVQQSPPPSFPAKSPPLMHRGGPTRAPPPPPSVNQGPLPPSNNEDYMSPVVANTPNL